MRQLFLLRHGKSSWDEPSLDDFDRPLSGRGIKAARRMGKHMAAQGIHPGVVLVSTARRTRATWELMEPHLKGLPVSYEDALYEAGRSELLDRLRALDDHLRSVMVVGHNPGLERLATHLCGGHGDAAALARLAEKFPTGTLAVLETEAPAWRDLQAGCCRLASFTRPADLDEKD